MRTEVVHFTSKNTNKILFMKHIANGSTNEQNRNKMKKILSKAISCELTDLQKHCIIEHYLNSKTGKEIAKELGVNASTVSRHINAARKKLRNIASYYM